MSTTYPSDAPSTEPSVPPREIINGGRPEPHGRVSSTPVEMSHLSSKPEAAPPSTKLGSMTKPSDTSLPISGSSKENALPQSGTTSVRSPPFTSNSPKESDPQPAPLSKAFSTAIGPSSDQPSPIPKDDHTGPILIITLLLTTGARHPFKLDPKYLAKRNVQVAGNDPFNLSVYKLKELILREWRDEWEQKPSSPNYIRLISFGKLLDDKAPLKDAKFNYDAPNVVHMTIKPQDFIDEEDTKGGKSGLGAGGEPNSHSPGCRCIVM